MKKGASHSPPRASSGGRTKAISSPEIRERERHFRAPHLRANPPILHFGGFHVDESSSPLVATVDIVNDAQVPIHIDDIDPPGTEEFRIRYEKTHFNLNPGLTQTVHVEFKPKEYQYHYDYFVVRATHQGRQELKVPIHAYPVVKKLGFPRYIDFGSVELNSMVQRSVKIENEVPVEFSYKIEALENDPAFEVDPMEGIIPPNGSTNVVIRFSPFNYTLSRMTLEVSCSQFNFAPIHCTVTGTSRSGLTQERMEQEHLRKTIEEEGAVLENLDNSLFNFSKMMSETGTVNTLSKAKRPPPTKGRSRSGEPTVNEQKEQLNEQRQLLEKKLNQLRHGRSAGAAADPGLTMLSKRFKQYRDQQREKEQSWWEETKRAYEDGTLALLDLTQEEKDISRERGLRVPESLSTVTAANFVLSQKPNHFTLKDLKIATEQQKALKREQRETQEKIREQYTSGKPTKNDLLRAVYGIPAILIDVRANHLISVLWTKRTKYLPSKNTAMESTGSLDVEFNVDELLQEISSRSDEDLHVLDKAMDEYIGLRVHSKKGHSTSLGDPMKLRRLVFSNEIEELSRAERDRVYASKDEWLGDDPPKEDEREMVLEEQRKLDQLESILRERALRRVRQPLQQRPVNSSAPALPQDRQVTGLPSWEGDEQKEPASRITDVGEEKEETEGKEEDEEENTESKILAEEEIKEAETKEAGTTTAKREESADFAPVVWKVRKSHLRRLRTVFSTGLVRLRVEKRLSQLQHLGKGKRGGSSTSAASETSILRSKRGKVLGSDFEILFSRHVFPQSTTADDTEFRILGAEAKTRMSKLTKLAQNASELAIKNGQDPILAKKAALFGISPTGVLAPNDDYEEQEIKTALLRSKPREAMPKYGLRAIRAGKTGQLANLDMSLVDPQEEDTDENRLERLIDARYGLIRSSDAFHPYIGTMMARDDFQEPRLYEPPTMSRAEVGVVPVPVPAYSDYPPLETMRSLESGALSEDPIGCSGEGGVPVSGWNQTFTKEWVQAAEDQRTVSEEEGRKRKKELRQSMSKLSRETGVKLFTDEDGENLDIDSAEDEGKFADLPLFPFRIRPPFCLREVDVTQDPSLKNLLRLADIRVPSHQTFWRNAASLLGPAFLDPGHRVFENFSLKGRLSVNERATPFQVTFWKHLMDRKKAFTQAPANAGGRPASASKDKKKKEKVESSPEAPVVEDNEVWKKLIGYEPAKAEYGSLPIFYEALRKQPILDLDPRKAFNWEALLARYLRVSLRCHPDDRIIAAATGVAPASFTFSGIGDFDCEGVETPNENAHQFWNNYLASRDLLDSDQVGIGIGASLPGYVGSNEFKKEDSILDFLSKAVDNKKKEVGTVHFAGQEEVAVRPPLSLTFPRPEYRTLAETDFPSVTSTESDNSPEGEDLSFEKREQNIAAYLDEHFEREFDNDKLMYDLNGDVCTDFDCFAGAAGYHSLYMSFHDETVSELDFGVQYDPFAGVDMSENYSALVAGDTGFSDVFTSVSAVESTEEDEATVSTETEIQNSLKLFGIEATEEGDVKGGSKGKKGKGDSNAKTSAKDKKGKKGSPRDAEDSASAKASESFVDTLFSKYPHLRKACQQSPLNATLSEEEGAGEEVSDLLTLKREESLCTDGDAERSVNLQRRQLSATIQWATDANPNKSPYSLNDPRYSASTLPHMLLEPVSDDQLSDDSESDVETPEMDGAFCRVKDLEDKTHVVTIFDLVKEFGPVVRGELMAGQPEPQTEQSPRASTASSGGKTPTGKKGAAGKGSKGRTATSPKEAEPKKETYAISAEDKSNDGLLSTLRWQCREPLRKLHSVVQRQMKNNVFTDGLLNPRLFNAKRCEPCAAHKCRILLNLRYHASLCDSMTTLGLSLAAYNSVLQGDTSRLDSVYNSIEWLRARWSLPHKLDIDQQRFSSGEMNVLEFEAIQAYERKVEQLISAALHCYRSKRKGGMGRNALNLLPLPRTVTEVDTQRTELRRRRQNLEMGSLVE
eukprot:gb/GECG01009135.1/.p1 GENE.gb/GECG01009135.1/~~gb/GECG01009135.1/.p1  ORF type:complete len:1989 (+),score=295.64 gb/GECG01009135.1/:1-5967(+)